jgi:SAF domain
VLLALLVVVLGGLVSMWAVSSYAHRDRVLVIAANVPVGQRITVDDLAGADLSVDPRVSAFTVDQQGEVVGKVALVDLAKGTLVNPSQVGQSQVLTAGQVLVGLQLKPGQIPAVGLAPGQRVLLVATPVDTSGLYDRKPAGPDRGERRGVWCAGCLHRGERGRRARAGERGCVTGSDGARRERERGRAGLRWPEMTVVAVTGGKAGPGATTAALALGLSWPGAVLLVDADGAGGDMVPGMLPGRVGTERGLLSWLVATRRYTVLQAAQSHTRSQQVGVPCVDVGGGPSACQHHLRGACHRLPAAASVQKFLYADSVAGRWL